MVLRLIWRLLLKVPKLCTNTLIIQIYQMAICQVHKKEATQTTISRLNGFSTLISKVCVDRQAHINYYYLMATDRTLQQSQLNIVKKRIFIFQHFRPIQATFYNLLMWCYSSCTSTTIGVLLRWLSKQAVQTLTPSSSCTLYTIFKSPYLNPHLLNRHGRKLALFHIILSLF